MARDRKRAKQRRARRGAAASGHGPGPAPAAPADGSADAPATSSARSDVASQPLDVGRVERADLPGALEHAGDVDEFDAALIAGAGGVAANAETLSEAEIEAEAEVEGDLTEDELQEGAGSGGSGGDGVSPEQASGAPLRKGNRAIGFLRASWAELQRVQWPDRRHVFQATAVVLGFVAIAGAYLGLADYVAKEIVEAVL
ncbi:MAG TPA: preprotein translocase subunit SecE [Solirubrobacteraceae bacterium]|nr:preprotein translocase subunit SecE [Solirubrobacteraceae bacterium]